MIRILIVDDQNLVQQGIKSLLDRDLDFKVIGTVTNGRNAVQQIAQIHPDIVLLDIEMPGMNGITTTKYINQISPKTKVIILSSHEERKYVTQALMAGAKGYILKSSLMADLKQAILAVHNGYSQIDSRLLAKVFNPQNIKSKKSNLSQKSEVTAEDSLNKEQQTDSSDSKSNENEVAKVNHQEFQKSDIHLSSSSSTSHIKPLENVDVRQYKPLEADTKIQSEKVKTLSADETIYYEEPRKSTSNISDAVVLQQVKSKEKSFNQLNIHPQISPTVLPKTALVPVKPPSNKLKRKSSKLSKKFKQKTSAITIYLKELLDHPQISVHKPKIDQLKLNLEPYKDRLESWLKKKRNQRKLWNTSLAILGILMVLLIGQI